VGDAPGTAPREDEPHFRPVGNLERRGDFFLRRRLGDAGQGVRKQGQDGNRQGCRERSSNCSHRGLPRGNAEFAACAGMVSLQGEWVNPREEPGPTLTETELFHSRKRVAPQ